MQRVLAVMALYVVLVFLAGGCASGPAYPSVAAQIPPIQKGYGRIFFLRDAQSRESLDPFDGVASCPPVLIDGKQVGTSIPGGFFFADVPAGDHLIGIQQATLSRYEVDITLRGGDVRYVETWPGSEAIQFVTPIQVAVLEGSSVKRLQDKHYTGSPLPSAASQPASGHPHP